MNIETWPHVARKVIELTASRSALAALKAPKLRNASVRSVFAPFVAMPLLLLCSILVPSSKARMSL